MKIAIISGKYRKLHSLLIKVNQHPSAGLGLLVPNNKIIIYSTSDVSRFPLRIMGYHQTVLNAITLVLLESVVAR